MAQYLHASGGRVGSIGKVLLVQPVLVTWAPRGQEALVAAPVSDGVW